jgi:predicted MPP superfamily phosphohydrolase
VKKIIHLSDLHVGHKECGDRFRLIIDSISKSCRPSSDYVTVITGDIADNAFHEEQREEAVSGIKMLEEQGYRVLLIPGNHDYGTGIMGSRKFVGVFKEKFFGNRRISYPKVDLIDDFAFVGLDSTAGELNWNDRFFSEGELGKAQLSRLKRILNKPEVTSRRKIVYLHHHPFDFKLAMQLKDSDELKEIIENRIEILLFGHYHRDEETATRIYHGTWGIPRCYNAGSSTRKNGETGFQWIINTENDNPSGDFDAKFI